MARLYANGNAAQTDEFFYLAQIFAMFYAPFCGYVRVFYGKFWLKKDQIMISKTEYLPNTCSILVQKTGLLNWHRKSYQIPILKRNWAPR
jgi:hypothetical protein